MVGDGDLLDHPRRAFECVRVTQQRRDTAGDRGSLADVQGTLA
jgi:hypothetical protein